MNCLQITTLKQAIIAGAEQVQVLVNYVYIEYVSKFYTSVIDINKWRDKRELEHVISHHYFVSIN